jgi:ribosomal protein S24E
MKCLSFLVFSLINSWNGYGQDHSQSYTRIMDSVARLVLASIREGEVAGFRSFIGPDLSALAKNDEGVRFDVGQIRQVLNRYMDHDNEQIVITDLYNRLGQRQVKIPIYDYSNDTVNAEDPWVPGVKTLFLEFDFGPPSLFPLNKITGYGLIRNNSDSSDFKPKKYWFSPRAT